MSSPKDFITDIIDEYNLRFQTWGNSDSWRLTEFKLLEDIIFESSGVRIDSNTLKRFFQQRTSNPQTATINALCVFLGYQSYSDFIVKKTAPEKEETEQDIPIKEVFPEIENDNLPFEHKLPKDVSNRDDVFLKFKKKHFVWLIILGLALITALSWSSIQKAYKNYLISKVSFTANDVKGTSPLTVKFDYNIPHQLLDSIYVEFREPNGDLKRQKLTKAKDEIFITYIYVGRCLASVKYSNKVIKTIEIETRNPGWAAYVRDDKIDYFQNIPFEDVTKSSEGISLPKDKIPKEVDTEKLFVSYTLYKPDIIDGDNFIFETKIRNSPADNGIPCYDVMMYAFSDSLFHCFSLNNSCYSYLKFISGDKTIKGENQDLSHIQFNSFNWHIMRIEVINKHTTFYLDDKVALKMDYNKPVGKINELTLRFKGCGIVQYVKVLGLEGNVVFEENFSK